MFIIFISAVYRKTIYAVNATLNGPENNSEKEYKEAGKFRTYLPQVSIYNIN